MPLEKNVEMSFEEIASEETVSQGMASTEEGPS